MSASKKQKTTEHVILVTGASGLVGRAIQSVVNSPDHVPVGNERWVFLSSKDGDLRDPAATQAIFEKHNPTHVIHLAAFVGGLFKNMQFGVQFFEDNMHMTMNVLKMAVSSGQVFGSSTRSFCLFVGSNVLFRCVVPMCCSNVLLIIAPPLALFFLDSTRSTYKNASPVCPLASFPIKRHTRSTKQWSTTVRHTPPTKDTPIPKE